MEFTSPSFSYSSALYKGSQIVDFYSKEVNFTELAKEGRKRVLLSSVVSSSEEYRLTEAFLEYNPYSFEEGFPYASCNLPCLELDIREEGESKSLLDRGVNLTEPLVVYFDVHREVSRLRRVDDFRGNYVCMQWDEACLKSEYVSVLYVRCECYKLGRISLVEDYLYRYVERPSYPPPLWSVLYIVFLWAPFVVLFVSFQLWAFTQDNKDSTQLKIKQDQDMRKRSMRASVILRAQSMRKSDLMARPTVKGDVFSELVKADGVFGDKPLNREQTQQIQQSLGKAKGYKNIRLDPAPVEEENIYVPNEDDANDKKEENDELQKMLRVIDVLVTHSPSYSRKHTPCSAPSSSSSTIPPGPSGSSSTSTGPM